MEPSTNTEAAAETVDNKTKQPLKATTKSSGAAQGSPAVMTYQATPLPVQSLPVRKLDSAGSMPTSTVSEGEEAGGEEGDAPELEMP